MLVEQGILGALLYLALVAWTVKSVMKLRRMVAREKGFLPSVFPGVAAILGAILIGDLFVDYLKFEARWWFIGVTMALLNQLSMRRSAGIAAAPLPDSAIASDAAVASQHQLR